MIKKFNDQLIREKEENEKIIEFKKDGILEKKIIDTIIDNSDKKKDEKY